MGSKFIFFHQSPYDRQKLFRKSKNIGIEIAIFKLPLLEDIKKRFVC